MFYKQSVVVIIGLFHFNSFSKIKTGCLKMFTTMCVTHDVLCKTMVNAKKVSLGDLIFKDYSLGVHK